MRDVIQCFWKHHETIHVKQNTIQSLVIQFCAIYIIEQSKVNKLQLKLIQLHT